MSHPTPLALILATTLTLLSPYSRQAVAQSGGSDEPKMHCPDVAAGETAEDCPWAGAARVLTAEAEAGHSKRVTSLFRELLPDLHKSLQSDSHRAAWKGLWGRSINFDELAKAIIVHPDIVEALGQSFGTRTPMILTHFKAETLKGEPLGKPIVTDPAGHQLVHAGMEHTYGYLFSLIKTSFGYKRARWVQGEIELGFGLKPGLLGPKPESGTLFSNVTYFAGRIAFRDDEHRTSILKKGAHDLPQAIRDFDFSKLSPIRLEETVEAKDSTGDVRKVILRTDFVPFFHPQKDTSLLIYSIVDPSYAGSVIITAFPVTQSFVEMATAADGLGEGKPVQTRYNGFVDGVTGVSLTGTRKVIR